VSKPIVKPTKRLLRAARVTLADIDRQRARLIRLILEWEYQLGVFKPARDRK
jgi:hypothetical protein